MPAPARVALGASTVNRKWWIDIVGGTEGAPEYIGVHGIQEFKDNIEPTTQDDSDFDGNGWKSETVTALLGKLEFKVGRKTTKADKTKYDPGQEVLRKAARKTGVANVVKIRYYEMEPNGPREEAYEVDVAVSWTPDGGGMDATSTATVALTFQGEPAEIAHPDAA